MKQLSMFSEIIVDNFAGGGGASTGIEMAIGKSVDIAINHDPAAIAMHRANHPKTEHYCENVWEVDPVAACGGRKVALAWFSPDCKHFSKAKGGKPVEKSIRGLAWVAIRWAKLVRPRVIMLENVEEFKTWGPLMEDSKPDPRFKGRTFKHFVHALKRYGYKVDWRELRACDYGAPTIRKRFFLIARCDGQPITWPEATHGDPKGLAVQSGRLKPWRTAAEIIDWSIDCKSIFERKKPLCENTMKRIAKGLKKFVLDNPEPFIVTVNHGGEGFRGQSLHKPLTTVTAKNGCGVVEPKLAPYVMQIGQQKFGGDGRIHSMYDPLATIVTKNEHCLVKTKLAPYVMINEFNNAGSNIQEPLHTILTGNHHYLMAPTLIQYHGEQSEKETRGQALEKPLMVVDSSNRYGLVSAYMMHYYGTSIGSGMNAPLGTITAQGQHIAEVQAFLVKYYGQGGGQSLLEPLHTITTKDRFGLVMIKGQAYQIVDIGMRMLTPRELFNAQGFPSDYIIDHDADGNTYYKNAQVARCGNAVPPPFAKALVRANLPELCDEKKYADGTAVS